MHPRATIADHRFPARPPPAGPNAAASPSACCRAAVATAPRPSSAGQRPRLPVRDAAATAGAGPCAGCPAAAALADPHPAGNAGRAGGMSRTVGCSWRHR
ncbi:hypothetical protein B1808_04050 [Pseudofulvimonas gallinarii]|nr:hypothetical protein B1808_04050 [Pseudofulvimonas gallinarii]